jgi:hypothetical protein
MISKLTAISGNNRQMKRGDDVFIGGDLKLSKQVVIVVSEMREMLGDGKKYKIEEIKIKYKNDVRTHLCRVNGWWFSPKNLYKKILIKNPKVEDLSEYNFDINTLVT